VASQLHLVLAVPALVIGAYYTFVRFRPLPAMVFNGLGLAAFAFTGNVLSSILTMYSGRGFPMTDAALAAADRLVGFDWMGLLHLLDRHPGVNAVLRTAYDTIIGQIPLIIAVLAVTRHAHRMYRFMIALNLALIVTCAIAVFFPALGPYEFYGVSPADHPNIALATEAKMMNAISWLRAAQWSVPAPQIEVGLISFPSFHAATAVAYMWAMWRTPVARWIWLAQRDDAGRHPDPGQPLRGRCLRRRRGRLDRDRDGQMGARRQAAAR
jgi:hypothetical protein